MIPRLRLLLFLAILLAGSSLAAARAWADDTLVVIGHPDLRVASMTRAEVVNIFMGRFRKLPSGSQALVMDSDTLKAAFYARLVNKTLAEINAYWARLTFSGQTTPPRQVTAAQVLEIVARTPGAIGYIESRHVDERVKVLFELTRSPGKPY